MKLYISGGITNVPDYKTQFKAAERKLTKSGYKVINPADFEFTEGATYDEMMRFDLMQLLGCDGVALLGGWEKSKGANIEASTALKVGIPVYDVDYWLVNGKKELDEVCA
ncbi:DUF4406 domain-containing protein [Treponema phagedenis]|uniref:DUF4406 domain-containing protein n=1 Tax=Treponema phagedenis TaxID=162 RepID=UPI0011EEA8BF|nr:DUF4406 domain-containing protein [Treponema phagedenis]TYT77806.1 DUF4406 domain-containing protein [Treponema phagedenis]